MQVRGTVVVRCRTECKNNAGLLQDGVTPWNNRTFEAVDEDDNKLTIRVSPDVVTEIGKRYSVTADVESQSATRVRITAVALKAA